MHKIVGSAFKAIMISIILVIIFDVASYVMRVNALNSKIESLAITMQQEVSKNNYLTEESYNMYAGMLKQIKNDMNGVGRTDVNGNSIADDSANALVMGYNINYDKPCTVDVDDIDGITFSEQLNTPANYGDIAIIEITVYIHQLTWGFNSSADSGIEQTERNFNINKLTYTYQVPCLRYIKVES